MPNSTSTEYPAYTREQCRDANQMFIKYAERLMSPVKNGLAIREQLIAEINGGKLPTHYRFKFLQESTDVVINTLQTLAIKFNQDHARDNDQCSVQDLKDILNNTLNLLKK